MILNIVSETSSMNSQDFRYSAYAGYCSYSTWVNRIIRNVHHSPPACSGDGWIDGRGLSWSGCESLVAEKNPNASSGPGLAGFFLKTLHPVCPFENTHRLQKLSGDFVQFFPDGFYSLICQPVNHIKEICIKRFGSFYEFNYFRFNRCRCDIILLIDTF